MSRKFRSSTGQTERRREGLPLDRPVAQYYRQSTGEQIGNISTDLQTVDLDADLLRMGWSKDKIILIDADAGVSGTLKISEREGMRQLFDLITEKKIGAVATQDEDRLFRDVTQIQVNLFIEECKQNNVVVITPTFVYDFAHPQTGMFHARQFRFKSEMAAEYINTIVIGKLGAARRFLMRTGRWAGAAVPVGYMVDLRETVNGSANMHYRKYVPFEVYADVIREYYRLFLEFGGDMARTHYYIRTHRICYPDPKLNSPPEGFRAPYHMALRPWGYGPGRHGLKLILTNPAYVGHWVFEQFIVQWNNHEPLISERDFRAAMNYLSEVNLDGTPNLHYRPARQNARPTLEADRTVPKPLCTGLIVANIKGKTLSITTSYRSEREEYAYILSPLDDMGMPTKVWSRQAKLLDEAVTYHVLEMLRSTFRAELWADSVEAFIKSSEKERKFKEKELKAIQQEMENILGNLAFYSTREMIEAVERRYITLEQERSRKISELAAMDANYFDVQNLIDLRNQFNEVLSVWDDMTRDEKHLIIRKLVDRIELTDFKTKSACTMKIYWRDGSTQDMIIRKGATGGRDWSYADIQKIKHMLAEGLTRKQIRLTFPNYPKSTMNTMLRSLSRESATNS